MRFVAVVASRRLGALPRVLAPALVALITPEHRGLGALLVDHDEIDGNRRPTRPAALRRLGSIPDKVACKNVIWNRWSHGAMLQAATERESSDGS